MRLSVKGSWSKSYFLICFAATCFISIFWASVIVFALVTHKLTMRNWLALFTPLVFFIWGAKEMLAGYRGKA